MSSVLIGAKYGRWTVLKKGKTPTGRSAYLCECECGSKRWVQGHHLIDGTSKSCGCLSRALSIARHKTHGMSDTHIYFVWRSMLTRCESSQHPTYKNHGARGICVCEEWHEFSKFYDWALKTGYVDRVGLTLDRIDNDGDYEPSNCRWTDMRVQSNNRRTNSVVEINGRAQTRTQWAREFGINIMTVNSRINISGWDEIRALTTPVATCKWEAMRKTDPSKIPHHKRILTC